MIRNYLKIAWRMLVKHKTLSIINITGLSIGIASCLIIMMYVQHELSFDRYHEKADQIVRVVFKGFIGGGDMKEAHVMPPVAETLKRDYPEVLETTRLMDGGTPFIRVGDKAFKGNKMAYADPNFFEVFSFSIIHGNKKTALTAPNSIAVSKQTADKFFGTENPIGKLIRLKDTSSSFTVTAVFDNIPDNSHFHFDLIASIEQISYAKSDNWMTSGFFTYLVLPKGYDYKQLERKLPQTAEKYMGPPIQMAFGINYHQFIEKGNSAGLFLQRLTDIHLHSDLNGDLSAPGDIRYVYIFGVIAFFMLLIACINFMNLSTAGASRRAREVGIRKVLGSLHKELIKQFLFESILITFISLIVAVLFLILSIPLLNSIAETRLSALSLISNPWLLPGLFLFGLFVGTLAGSYPAFFLSSFKPVSVLKGKFSAGRNSVSMRSGLVIFQFIASVTLIISIIIIYKQLFFIQHKKLGFDKEQVLVLENTWNLENRQEAFRNELLRNPAVRSVSTASFIPAGNNDLNNNAVYPNDKVGQYVKTPFYIVDTAYLNTLGIKLIAGRNFSAEYADSASAIINKTAAEAFGWGKQAIGNTLTDHINYEGKEITYRIIGVVEDFHFNSFKERISPMMMVLGGYSGMMIVKIKTADINGLLDFVKSKWTGDEPMSYSFMDDRFNLMYSAEQKTSEILSIFAGLTLFVACIGLFGLTIFTTQQQTKEIGIRKVLGASSLDITRILSKDFIKLILIAIVIASPIAWYLMNTWLQDFAYRINIQWWIFVITGVFVLIIALITISFQSIKAALMNPVKSLRTE